MTSKLVLVGRVAGAFGVKGEVRLTAYTERPEALLAYRDLVRQDGSPGLSLLSGRAQKGDLIARAGQVATKEAADALRGLQLFVPREALPEPEADEYYLTDLIGLLAVTPGGETLGKVKAVQDFGAGDILEIAPGRGAAWYLPFTRECVPEVDVAGGKVVVVRPVEVPEKGPSPSRGEGQG
jgi:16S rRNA processing protein RimM